MHLKVKDLTDEQIITYIHEIIKQSDDYSEADDKAELGNGCKYEHVFTPGLYIRKMFIPKDVIIVTMVHKTEHPYFILYGDVSVFLDGGVTRIKAPYQGITKVGTIRALRTHEDTLWATVHVTEKVTLKDITKDLVCRTMDEYKKWEKQITYVQEDACS